MNPRRLEGVDLARALAIIGMLMVHVGPMYEDGLAGQLFSLPHGRASVLFVLVAGVGVALLARARRGAPGALSGQLLWRAALLLPLGLVLQVVDEGRLVILQSYALLFVLAVGMVHLPDRPLLALVGLSALGGPVAFLYGRMHQPLIYDRSSVALGQPPGEILHGLALSGPYPVITWLAPFALGIWIGRRDLRDARVVRRLLFGGLAGAAAAIIAAGLLQGAFGEAGFEATWAQLRSVEPHSQMPLWLGSATALAAAVLGLALMLVELAGRALWPLVAVGQVALTFYVAHLLALTAWPQVLETGEVGEAVWICVALTGIAALLAMTWRALLPRGPLEMLLQPPWRVAGRWRAARD